jgi:hypothetical protein
MRNEYDWAESEAFATMGQFWRPSKIFAQLDTAGNVGEQAPSGIGFAKSSETVNTDLVCVVCFGTNDRELVRFTTLRLNPKLDRELARTMVDSVIYYWSNGGQTSSTFQNVVLVEWVRRSANRIYRHRLPSTQNRKSKWVSKKSTKALE